MNKSLLKDIYDLTIGKIEYFFAKRWLDRHFGKREFWGDEIAELLKHCTL